MTKTMPTIAALWMACLLPAHAGTGVWRCASNVYSDAPCSEGRPLALADDARPAADIAAARAVAAREQRLADDLRDERLQREASNRQLPSSRTTAAPRPPRRQGAKQAKEAKEAKKAAAHAAAKEERLVKPKAAAAQRPARHPAAADIWRAVAPASPRGSG